MTGFGGAVGLAPHAQQAMLVVAVLMLVVGGAADMASAAFRTSMLQSAASDAVRGRLQGVFIVVVAGGPRIADVAARGRAPRWSARRWQPAIGGAPGASCGLARLDRAGAVVRPLPGRGPRAGAP